MDQTANIPNIVVANNKNQKIFQLLKVLAIPVLMLILGYSAGVITYPILPFTDKNTEENLPISRRLLINPMVYEWRGSIRGVVDSRGANSFTLRDELGNKIIISSQTANKETFDTKYFIQSGNTLNEASISAMEKGDKVFGDFFIFKDRSDIPVGSSFYIEK